MLTVDQVMASHKANFETLLGLTNKAFEGVEKIVELNMTASKAAMAEAGDHANGDTQCARSFCAKCRPR